MPARATGAGRAVRALRTTRQVLQPESSALPSVARSRPDIDERCLPHVPARQGKTARNGKTRRREKCSRAVWPALARQGRHLRRRAAGRAAKIPLRCPTNIFIAEKLTQGDRLHFKSTIERSPSIIGVNRWVQRVIPRPAPPPARALRIILMFPGHQHIRHNDFSPCDLRTDSRDRPPPANPHLGDPSCTSGPVRVNAYLYRLHPRSRRLAAWRSRISTAFCLQLDART